MSYSTHWKPQESGMCIDIVELTLWIQDHAAIIPKNSISKQLLQLSSCMQMYAALAKSATGGNHGYVMSLPFR